MREKKQETDQLNFYSTPVKLIERFDEFEHNYRKAYKAKKSVSRSEIGALVLETGLEVCEQQLEEKQKEKNHD